MMTVETIIRALGESEKIPSIFGPNGPPSDYPWEPPKEWEPPFGCTGENPDILNSIDILEGH